jgi:hypothetical protein
MESPCGDAATAVARQTAREQQAAFRDATALLLGFARQRTRHQLSRPARLPQPRITSRLGTRLIARNHRCSCPTGAVTSAATGCVLCDEWNRQPVRATRDRKGDRVGRQRLGRRASAWPSMQPSRSMAAVARDGRAGTAHRRCWLLSAERSGRAWLDPWCDAEGLILPVCRPLRGRSRRDSRSRRPRTSVVAGIPRRNAGIQARIPSKSL